MSRTIIFNLDGTWNGRDDKVSTNILKLHRALRDANHMSAYFAGPGNEDENNDFFELMGGLFGLGSNDIRDQAYTTLSALYQPGDKIVINGFSRGAAIARTFANKIGKEGVNGEFPYVDFLGCFDTVGAYLPFGPFQQGLFHDLHVSPCVKNAYHAVSLNEDRKAFIPNLMNQRQGVEEVWFRGIHSDIGGGYEDTGLSDIALEWMWNKMCSHGIMFGMEFNPDPSAAIGHAKSRWREDRRIGVQVDDEWSDIPAVFHSSVDQNLV